MQIAKRIRLARRRVRICSPVITTGPVLGTLAQVVADGSVDVAGCVDATQVRDVIRQWRLNGNVSWKLPLLQRVLAGAVHRARSRRRSAADPCTTSCTRR